MNDSPMLLPVKISVSLAQINCTVGDLAGNSRKIVDAARSAAAQGAQVLLTPELALCGYPPEDLLLREGFLSACTARLEGLALDAARAQCGCRIAGHGHGDNLTVGSIRWSGVWPGD